MQLFKTDMGSDGETVNILMMALRDKPELTTSSYVAR